MSYQAYQKTQQTGENPSQTEYRLFAQVTKALIDAHHSGNNVADALDWNRRMWSVLSTDCGTSGNSLPNELRAGIISLSIWVSKHSTAIMRGSESIMDLVEVNKTIMEGLAQQAKLQKAQNEKASTQGAPTNLGV